jgi:transmembrane sensor
MSLSFKELLHKYNAGECTPAEKAMVEAWYQQFELPGLAELSDTQLDEIMAMTPPLPARGKYRRLIVGLAAAAAVAVVISVGVYLSHKPSLKPVAALQHLQHDALPGNNKAILVLSNGQQIVLTDAQNGQLAQQGNVVVEKKTDGELNYKETAARDDEDLTQLFNTVSTPRGGQHHVVLADGSNVWLNAASSIKYPVAFGNKERQVSITGEAYFEITHQANQPFKVTCAGQTIEVLGTSFNVNAYADEPAVKTTLLQGAVRVTTNTGETALLKPGQQAISHDGLKVVTADTEAATDWKEGDFVFKNQTLPDIMRKISRWYNVDVNYGNYSNSSITFSGVVSRSRNLSAVLTMLASTTNLKFTVENNQITIANK